MKDDEKRWDCRYQTKTFPDSANDLVRDYSHLAKTGRALDIAAGNGRNALFLAKKGFQVEVAGEKCRGDGICGIVCPLDCFKLDRQKRVAILEKPEICICCGACVVQCQFDALCYADKKSRRISPDVVRKHKVGLSGKRKSQKKQVQIS